MSVVHPDYPPAVFGLLSVMGFYLFVLLDTFLFSYVVLLNFDVLRSGVYFECVFWSYLWICCVFVYFASPVPSCILLTSLSGVSVNSCLVLLVRLLLVVLPLPLS